MTYRPGDLKTKKHPYPTESIATGSTAGQRQLHHDQLLRRVYRASARTIPQEPPPKAASDEDVCGCPPPRSQQRTTDKN